MSRDNIYIQKFNLWRNITRKGCTASVGPGGVFCIWVGRNCSYNDCPRRSHEEIYVKGDESLEQEMEQLRGEITTKNEQITLLTEKLKIFDTIEVEKTNTLEVEKIESVEA